MSEDGTVLLDAAEPLPLKMAASCYGSDGQRFAIAGGFVKENFFADSGQYLKAVVAWDGSSDTWQFSQAELPVRRSH